MPDRNVHDEAAEWLNVLAAPYIHARARALCASERLSLRLQLPDAGQTMAAVFVRGLPSPHQLWRGAVDHTGAGRSAAPASLADGGTRCQSACSLSFLLRDPRQLTSPCSRVPALGPAICKSACYRSIFPRPACAMGSAGECRLCTRGRRLSAGSRCAWHRHGHGRVARPQLHAATAAHCAARACSCWCDPPCCGALLLLTRQPPAHHGKDARSVRGRA